MKKLLIITLLFVISCRPYGGVKNKNERIGKLKSELVTFYDSSNDYSKSRDLLNSRIALDSLDGEWYYKRGFCNQRLLKLRESNSDFNHCISLNYRMSDTYYNLGLNGYIESDSTAMMFFEKSLQYDSTNANSKVELNKVKLRIKKEKDGKEESPIEKKFREAISGDKKIKTI